MLYKSSLVILWSVEPLTKFKKTGCSIKLTILARGRLSRSNITQLAEEGARIAWVFNYINRQQIITGKFRVLSQQINT